MKVKKFIAPSMPEAMKQIRAELGNDAVILNSKIVHTGGFLGLFRKKNIEVIAAVDHIPTEKEWKKENKKVVELKKPTVSQMKVDKTKETFSTPNMKEDVLQEIKELKQLLNDLSTKNEGEPILPKPVQKVNEILAKQEIDHEIIRSISGSLIEKWYKTGANSTFDDVVQWSKEEMEQKIAHLPFGELSFQKKYVNVVGPTGVGKTTTLAKIAADCILKFNKKVALITTDTYRIAAIDQLKTYGKILSVPLEVCYNLTDFHHACEKFKDYDVILIDTAGRNFRNEEYVTELKKLIDFNENVETYLVLSLTAKQNDMEEIYEQFSSIPIDRFIFTKLDETSTCGSMYNLILKYEKGVAYITNGQNVPDDRITASSKIITNLIFKDEHQ